MIELQKSKLEVVARLAIKSFKSFNTEWDKIVQIPEPTATASIEAQHAIVEISSSSTTLSFIIRRKDYYLVGYTKGDKAFIFGKRKKEDGTIEIVKEEDEALAYEKKESTCIYSYETILTYLITLRESLNLEGSLEFVTNNKNAFEFAAFFISECARLEPCRIAINALWYKIVDKSYTYPAGFYGDNIDPEKINRQAHLVLMKHWMHMRGDRRSVLTVVEIQTYLNSNLEFKKANETMLISIGILENKPPKTVPEPAPE